LIRIDVNVDASLLLKRLENGEKRLAFAVVNAINSTMKAAQQAVKENARAHFAIRKESFVLGGPGRGGQIAIIKPFASVSQGRAYAEMAIGKKERLLLSEYETGGERQPFKGHSIAVPIPGSAARPSFALPVPASMKFTALKLRLTPRSLGSHRRGARGAADAIRYGLLRTYQVPGVGVFQRGEGGESRLIYAFVKEEHIAPRLSWIDVATRTIGVVFQQELDSQVDDVLIRRGLTRAQVFQS
jgi:hypothetical protein